MPIAVKLITDCLEYWIKEMHVDGFRFDEASILARSGDDKPLPYPPVLWHIELDEVLADTKIIVEAWDAAGLYQVGSFPGYRWAELTFPFGPVVVICPLDLCFPEIEETPVPVAVPTLPGVSEHDAQLLAQFLGDAHHQVCFLLLPHGPNSMMPIDVSHPNSNDSLNHGNAHPTKTVPDRETVRNDTCQL